MLSKPSRNNMEITSPMAFARRNYYFYFIKIIVALFCVVFFCFAFAIKAEAAIYYVDNLVADTNVGSATPDFTAYNHATFQTTGGADSVFATVADINAFTGLQPGDQVLFRKGQVWREMLTVPASGTSENSITFSSYGTGNNPILNGSQVVLNANFSDYSLTASSTTYDGGTATSNQADGATRNYRELILGSNITVAATGITLTFQAADSGGSWVIVGAGIGEQDSGSTVKSMTRITFGGNNGVTIAAGATATSDTINFTLTPGTNYLVHLYFTARYLKSNGTKGNTLYYNSTVADGSQDLSGTFSAGTIGMVRSISSVTSTTIYRAEQATDPYAVWEDGTFLTSKSSLAECASASAYYWDGSTYLYVHAGDSSNVVTNGKTYEIGQQTENFRDNSKSYIILDGINCIRTGSSDVYLGGIKLTGTNNIIRNLSSYSHRRHSISFYTGSQNNLAENLTLYDSSSTTPVSFYHATTTGNTLRKSTVYQTLAFNSATDVIVLHENTSENIVEQCDIYNVTTSANGTLLKTYGNSHDNIIRHNRLRGANAYAATFQDGSANVLFSNLIDGTFTTPIRCIGQTGVLIYNNTFYQPSATGYGIRLYSSATGATIKNNIIWHNTTYILVAADSQSGFTSDNNIYYGAAGSTPFTWGSTAYSFANWKTNSSQDANSLNSNPLFTTAGSDYTLQSTSPAINAGANLGATYDDAIYPTTTWPSSVTTADQDLRGSGWEIGAYIYPVPQAPTIGDPAAQSSSSIRWSFTDNADDETGFRIYDGTATLVASSATANLTYVDETSLTENTQYTGRYAKAYNSYGESVASSASASKYTLAPTPSSLAGSGTGGANTATLTAAELTNSASGQSGYYFYRQDNESGNNSGWITTNTWANTDNSFGCRQYQYYVKYRNGDGIETATASLLLQPFGCGGSGGGAATAPVTPWSQVSDNAQAGQGGGKTDALGKTEGALTPEQQRDDLIEKLRQQLILLIMQVIQLLTEQINQMKK